MDVFGTSGTLPPNTGNIATNIAGVEGHSIQNPGVFGRSIENSGVAGESLQSQGVLGPSASGYGILGVTFASTFSPGVMGTSTTGGDGVVGFVGGTATGVIGNSIDGTGVYGVTGSGNGVLGDSLGGTGMLGRSETDAGVRGISQSAEGVVGLTYGLDVGVWGLQFSSGDGSGVFGESVLGNGVDGFSFSGIGVRGQGRNGGVQGVSTNPQAGGVIGENPDGYAGVFLGDVTISRNLYVTGWVFKGAVVLRSTTHSTRKTSTSCTPSSNPPICLTSTVATSLLMPMGTQQASMWTVKNYSAW